MWEELAGAMRGMGRRLEELETAETGTKVAVSNHNVSDPPQDNQLDSAFGTPAEVGEGFVGIVNDEGVSQRVWLCASVGGAWWYVEMVLATEPAD